MPQRESLYVTWLFHMKQDTEVAQTGVHITTYAGQYDAGHELDALTLANLTALDTAMFKLLSSPGFAFADYGLYLGLKVAAVGQDGAYVKEPRIFTRQTPYTGSGGGFVIPQASVVLSLLGGNLLRKGNRGRVYLPYTSASSSNTGSPRIPANLVGLMATAAKTFVVDVNAAVSVGGSNAQRVSIVSQQPASAEPFTAEPVVTVKVGDIVDTQRRRRNKLAENYSTVAVPAP